MYKSESEVILCSALRHKERWEGRPSVHLPMLVRSMSPMSTLSQGSDIALTSGILAEPDRDTLKRRSRENEGFLRSASMTRYSTGFRDEQAFVTERSREKKSGGQRHNNNLTNRVNMPQKTVREKNS